MIDTADPPEVQAPPTWPGYPAIPPCVAGVIFQWDDDSTIAAAYLAAYLAAPQQTLLNGLAGYDDSYKCFDTLENSIDALWCLARRYRDESRWRGLFDAINADAVHWGFPAWDWDAFEIEFAKAVAYERATPEQQGKIEEAETALDEKKLIRDALGLRHKPKPGGRPKTEQTSDAKLVSDTLGVSQRRAYQILQFGTGKISNRVALAEAFSEDPYTLHPGSLGIEDRQFMGRGAAHVRRVRVQGYPYTHPGVAGRA